MRTKLFPILMVLMGTASIAALGGEVTFSKPPQAVKAGAGAKITFAVSKKTDVEVALLDAKGRVVRHLAAGVLGGETPPPPPLKAGLSQSLAWDGRDDFGKPATGGPFKVRARLGLTARLDGFLVEAKEWIGTLRGLATDSKGNLYVYSSIVDVHRGHSRCMQVFDRNGKYLRTIMPMPVNVPKERLLPFNTTNAYRNKLVLDPSREHFYPRNYYGTWPEFYQGGMGYLVPRVAGGVLRIRDGSYSRIAGITPDGGCAGKSFWRGTFKEKLWKNWRDARGAQVIVPSPDGKLLYLSGFSRWEAKAKRLDPKWPLGRIYRMKSAAGGYFEKWADLKAGEKPAAAGAAALDPDGNLLVWNGGVNKVVVLDKSGKRVGEFGALITLAGKSTGPRRLFCHRKSGEVYADYLCSANPKKGIYQRKLVKYASWKKGGGKIAEFDLPVYQRYYAQEGYAHAMALDDSAEPALIWAGYSVRPWTYPLYKQLRPKCYLLRLEDRGTSFAKTGDLIERCRSRAACKSRLAVHPDTDLVIYNDGFTGIGAVNGLTGERVKLPFPAGQDMNVGLNGNWYAQTGGGYSGYIRRFDRHLKPIPVKTPPTGGYKGSAGARKGEKPIPNALGFVYGRQGAGFCTVGFSADQRGRVYSLQMYKWARYTVAIFGADGKPEDPGRLREQPDMKKAGRFKSGIIGPIPAECGGIQLDREGNIYLGLKLLPVGHKAPEGYGHEYAGYYSTTGTIIKFGPQGGGVVGAKDAAGKKGLPIEDKWAWGSTNKPPKKLFAEGALKLYPGLGNMGGAFGDGCMCRQPMFQVDGWGRLFVPNAALNHVRVLDNAGNEITRFGHYGNIDSRGPGKDSTIKTPAAPLGWPQAVGVSRKCIYVADVVNRRIVRMKKVYAAEAACPVK